MNKGPIGGSYEMLPRAEAHGYCPKTPAGSCKDLALTGPLKIARG